MAVDVAHELAILERQAAYFSSDEFLRDRAAVWRDLSPEECLVSLEEQCQVVEQLHALKTPEELAIASRPTPIPADTIALLEALQRVK